MKEDGTQTEEALLSHDELLILAHLRMSKFSMRSALKYMQRTDLPASQVSSFINRRFKNSDRFFHEFGPKVHAARKKGVLPEVTPPAVKPRGETFIFGTGPRTRKPV